MDLNVAYFHTFYQHKKTSEKVQLSAEKSINYSSCRIGYEYLKR